MSLSLDRKKANKGEEFVKKVRKENLDMLTIYEDAADYMLTLTKHVAYDKAITFAREVCLDEDVVQSLIAEHTKIAKKLEGYNEKLINKMDIGKTNMVRLNELWYAVALIGDKGQRLTAVDPINESDVHIVLRDLNTERSMTKKDYERIQPGIINCEEIKKHEEEIQLQVKEILHTYSRIKVDLDVANDQFEAGDIILSENALRWWADNTEKKEGHSSYAAPDSEMIISEIRTAFGKATLEYTDENGLSYFINKTKLLLFIVWKGVLGQVSHYEFGYIPQINRQILVGLIKHIKKLKIKTEEEENRIAAVIEEVKNEGDLLQIKIDETKAQLDQLILQKLESDNKLVEIETKLIKIQKTLAVEIQKVYPYPTYLLDMQGAKENVFV